MHTIFWRANYVHNSPPEYELCISHKLHRSPILGYLFQVQALKTVIASKYRNDSVRPFGLSRFHSSKNYYAPLIRPCNSFSRTTFPTWTRDDKVPTYHHKKKSFWNSSFFCCQAHGDSSLIHGHLMYVYFFQSFAWGEFIPLGMTL